MGIVKFKIDFDKLLKIYHPGQAVKGKIFLALNSPKKCRGVKAKIKGEAKISCKIWWHRKTKVCIGHEEYFEKTFYIVGKANGEEIELTADQHVFPFEYTLPLTIPSSFESKIGHIRYTVKGIIDRPWKFDNETKDAFTVVSNFDLNTDNRALQPVAIEKIKTIGCFSPFPPITADLSLPIRGLEAN